MENSALFFLLFEFKVQAMVVTNVENTAVVKNNIFSGGNG